MTSIFLLVTLLFDIRGVVSDPSGRPVEAVKIACGGASASTDSTGGFSLNTDKACTASVEKNGFATQTLSLDPAGSNKVVLALAGLSERVVVTTAGAPVAIDEAGVAADVFTAKDLEVRQYAPVADILRDVAGVTVVQSGGGGGLTNLFSRGGGSDGALVLLDGVPLTDPGGNIDLVSLTTQGLDRLEVIRGPESALFGAEAATGVVQMFTKHGDVETKIPHGSILYERGSFSTDHWTADINGGLLRRFDYALIADQYHTTGEFPNSVFRNTTGTANIGFHLSDATTIRAIYREFDSYSGLPGQTFYNLFDTLGYQGVRDSALTVRLDDARGSRFNQRAYFAYHRNRNHSADPTEDSLSAAALVRTVPGNGALPFTYLVGLVPLSTKTAPSGTQLVQASTFPFPFDLLSISDRTSGNYQGTLAHRGGAFTFGYEYERQAGLISGADVDRSNNGITLYDQYEIGNRIFLTGGARIEHSSAFGGKFAPRGAVTFRLPTETYLRFSLARGIKEPSLLQNFAQEGFYVGNPNVKPETTDSFEVGLSHDWLRRRVHTDVSYFRNRYQNLITFTCAQPVCTYENIAQSWARGLEFAGSVRIISTISIHANYTKLYTRDVGTALERLRRPRNSGAAYLQVTPRRWTLMAGARVVGERQDDDFTFGINRSPSFYTIYASGSFQATKNFAPFVKINNLTDEHYQEALGYSNWSRSASGGLRIMW